jgi:hypothetical protein
MKICFPRRGDFTIIFWTTLAFGDEPFQILKIIRCIGKDFSCHLLPEKGNCSVSWIVG